MRKNTLDPVELVAKTLPLMRKALGDGATLLDAAAEWHHRVASNHEAKWKATGNPIWVWRCLARMNALCVYASHVCAELRGRDFIEAPPSWCLAYFLESAFRIEALAALRDFRDENAAGFADAQLTPDQCAGLVPAALGFTRQGYSAFREYAADDLLRLLLEVQEVEHLEGRPPKITLDFIMETMGWQDERNARRRLARIKRERAKPPS